MKLHFTLPMPPLFNRTYGVGINPVSGKAVLYKKKQVKQWEIDSGWLIKKQRGAFREPVEGKLAVDIFFHFKNEPDIDGGLKVLLDLFQTYRIYQNDMQIYRLMIDKGEDIKDPRVDINIDKYE